MLKGESWKAQNAQKREKKSNSASRMRQINWLILCFYEQAQSTTQEVA